jgi:hypothetical protein
MLLGVLFNMVAPAERCVVFLGIVAYAEKTKSLEMLEGQLEGVKEWVVEWGATPEQAQALYSKAAELTSVTLNATLPFL